MNFYISTIASDAENLAKRYSLGLEIAEYCTAYNMDTHFRETDCTVRKMIENMDDVILHAPFNELFPCAIDPKARELAAYRYRQAIDLAKQYGATKVVIHGGYNPFMYHPVWYTEQSILFWNEFLKEDPGIQIVLENVLEEEPGMLLDVVKTVDDSRLRLCLDVGHVNTYAKAPVMDWLEVCAPYISHFHIHNNMGAGDIHNALDVGNIPMAELLRKADAICPDATFTLEVMEAAPSINWLLEERLWNCKH